jgi:EAL domain-containing protein (putative c-di-GMP-specific phosphodiesterase class I)
MTSYPVMEALAAGQLWIALQPIVDLRRRHAYAYEALLRSESPLFPGPLDVLRAAVAEGTIGTLGRALRQMSVEACPDEPLFLNVHPNEFAEGWLVRPDDPMFCHDAAVHLEITESVPLTHFRYCHSVLEEVRSRGVYLAVDDLGAGYSNLKYIADLRPDVVKLDRELIAGLDRKERLHRLVTSLVRMCADLGAKVVAEGIETPGELAAVLAAGVRYGQGFLLGRPERRPAVQWSVFATA